MQTDEALALVQAGGGFGANRAPRDAQAQYLAKQEAYKHAPHVRLLKLYQQLLQYAG